MADKESIDVLMTFLFQPSGNPVAAEGTSKFDSTDQTMMKDFQEGYFFEVDDFTFGVSLGGSEGSQEAEGVDSSRSTGENVLHPRAGEEDKSGTKKAARKSGRSSAKFAKYIDSGQVGTNGAMFFKAEVQEITITKQVDISSIRFLDSCLRYKPFQKAVLVKRKFTGGFAFHEAFLRLEFREPLITGIEWDEGEIVKEKIKFVCRGIVAMYRPQNQDGTLGDARQTSWIPPRKVVGS